MALDKDCPCTIDCPDRPNCYGCVRGNQWRLKKQAEAKQRYINNAYKRHEIDLFNKKFNITVKHQKKPKRWEHK